VSPPQLPLPLLGLAVSVLAPAALVACVACLACDRTVLATVQRHLARLEADLRYLQLDLGARTVAWGQGLGCMAACVGAVAASSIWPLCGVALFALAPPAVLSSRRHSRTERLELQLDAGLLAIANALKASGSLADALSSAVQVVPRPLRDELVIVLREHGLGEPLDRALGNLAARTQSPVVTAATVTLLIARNAGGNVIRTLETSAEALREMARLEGVVRTKTAEGRAQSTVIAILPLPFFCGIDALDPHLLAPLWRVPAGHLVIAGACALWVLAIFLARKIVDVDI